MERVSGVWSLRSRIKESKNKIIIAEENKRKLTIDNPSGKIIRKIQVDGCLPIKQGKRCDYMFEINVPQKPVTQVIYLELKGCDIEKAYEQLIATINIFQAEHKGCNKECHIIASRVPKAGAKVQQLKVKILKTKQAKLFVNTNKAVISV